MAKLSRQTKALAFIFVLLAVAQTAREIKFMHTFSSSTTLRHSTTARSKAENLYASDELPDPGISSPSALRNLNIMGSTIPDSSTGQTFQGLKFRSFVKARSATLSNTINGDSVPDGYPLSQSFKGKCTKWGVVTTIFDPTLAVKRVASLPSWCLVIVADTKTPHDYMQKLSGLNYRQSSRGSNSTYDDMKNAYFFSVEKQKDWEGMEGALGDFVKAMPWRHFGRKNLGYLFALMHGASFIFDFDDDNFIKVNAFGEALDILPSEEVMDNVTIAIQGPNAFNHHPIMKPSLNGTSWARGFPLEYIQDLTTQGKVAYRKDVPFKSKLGTIGVIQFLADGNPDIDAFHRLSKPLPITFQSDDDAHPLLVPKHSYSPFNAQATIHTKSAFWAMLLPVSVPGRVSDIWRSYFAQCIFADAGLRLVFAPPKISQIRNDHNILGDLSAETDLYTKSGKLIEFLAGWDTEQDSIPGRMEQLWIDLYERGYIEIEDVIAVQKWLQTLMQIGYDFPPLRRRFRNVAVMGQFNYADSPKLHEEIILWAQKHREYFDTVLAAGPFSEETMLFLEKNSIQAIAVDKRPAKQGYFAPVENLMNALRRFKDSPKIQAVLYAHDDALINVTELSQGRYPFPSNDIIGNNLQIRSQDLSYVDVRTAADKEFASRMSYRIYPNGTVSDLNRTIYGESIHTLIKGIPNFYNNWSMLRKDDCLGGQLKMASDPDSDKYREQDGSLLFPSFTQADFLMVPTKYSDEFEEAARLHLKHGVYLECSIPKIVDMIRHRSGSKPGVRVTKLCTSWTNKRGRPEMSKKCRSKRGRAGILHPFKISQGLQAYADEMDNIQF